MFDTFGRFFVIMFANVSKPIPHSEGSEVLKIGQNQASTLPSCLGGPMATKRCQIVILGRSGSTFGVTLKPLWNVFLVYFEVFVEGFFDAF